MVDIHISLAIERYIHFLWLPNLFFIIDIANLWLISVFMVGTSDFGIWLSKFTTKNVTTVDVNHRTAVTTKEMTTMENYLYLSISILIWLTYLYFGITQIPTIQTIFIFYDFHIHFYDWHIHISEFGYNNSKIRTQKIKRH